MTNIKLPLFFTRVAIVIFLLPWALERFTNLDHVNAVAGHFYKFPVLPDIVHNIIGGLYLLLLLAFLIGFKKRISYGLVLLLHTVGTITTIPSLIPGRESYEILFMAAIPVIGAMWLLYRLRDQDTMLSVDK